MKESELYKRLMNFPDTSDNPRKLYELYDLLSEIAALKRDPKYEHLLSYYDTAVGVNRVVSKLSNDLKNKWRSKACKYKMQHSVPYPPFDVFRDFVKENATMLNDPSLSSTWKQPRPRPNLVKQERRGMVTVRKTETVHLDEKPKAVSSTPVSDKCPIHKDLQHTLNQCKSFRRKPIQVRKKFLRDNKICSKCCEFHASGSCEKSIKCDICDSTAHATAMHFEPQHGQGQQSGSSSGPHGGEPGGQHGGEQGTSLCTKVCGPGYAGRSCAKAVLVNVYPKDRPEKSIAVYALIDDQSDCSLGRPELFEFLDIPHSTSETYTLTTCSGDLETEGRRGYGLMVASLDGSCSMELPMVTECQDIPNKRSEIPTPEVVAYHDHLRGMPIPPLNRDAQILLLIGRDLIDAHIVHEQRTGPPNTPFAQRLSLGWVVVGSVCLGRYHSPSSVNVCKTTVLTEHRESVMELCPNIFNLKETVSRRSEIGSSVFQRSDDDDKVGLSMEDRDFLDIMSSNFERDPDGRWKAPLPFRYPRPRLPNNRHVALRRAYLLDGNLRRNPVKKEHMIAFMKGLMDSAAMEEAPPLETDSECWYLPLFGVYHPRKPDKIRGVFDSSLKLNDTSLNSILMSGPNLVNDLIAVLMRFREEKVAFIADVEQMFYRFLVREDHRDFLRFFWYRNNDPDDELMEYRMRVHVFGNTPSPAVATFGFRHIVRDADSDVRKYVNENFYVDDGLASTSTPAEAINLLKKTQTTLMDKGSIRLHKVASNSQDVLQAFPTSDLEKNLKMVNLCADELPLQQSLGLAWDLNTDCLTFSSAIQEKPFTRKGLLSMVNSLYDPLGIIAPITIQGRILIRQFCNDSDEWDQALPTEFEKPWLEWRDSLYALDTVSIPRMFTPTSFDNAASKEVHIYSDASEKAISAVAYLKTISDTGDVHVGFLMGKSKVAPTSGHTIPRLELCGALLATELGQIVFDSLGLSPDATSYYTDSMVVLGYINNRTRRFYNYVSNRVSVILKRSKPEQWFFVGTDDNPADLGTRCNTQVDELSTSVWLCGPPGLIATSETQTSDFPLVDPDNDKEVRASVLVKKTAVEDLKPLVTKLDRFSSWNRLVGAVTVLKRYIRSRTGRLRNSSEESVDIRKDAELFVIRTYQRASFDNDISRLLCKQPVLRGSALFGLNPFLDDDGILRVGGRLNQSPLSRDQRNPVIIHGKSHIGRILIAHHHEKIHHQGRVLTEGALISHVYWIISGKRAVASFLHKCVMCRKLRGRLEHQQMANLPPDRVTPGPPFSTIGVDVFGPWEVVARRTRGGQAHSKRWAVIFCCLTTRAVHIEVIDEMSSSAFINSFRRFTSIRGPVKEIRSDRGTNFVGALDDIGATSIFVEKGPVKSYLESSGIKWTFNPPHASHFGGSWERLIGLSRRILDAMLLENKSKALTHDVLCTFMYEVCAILNSRPICPITYDPDNPFIISPSMLLTQKPYMDNLPSSVSTKEMYQSAWKHVQLLSDTFWKRWKGSYLQSLQVRRTWQDSRPNVKVGDIVLMRDKQVNRGCWPMALVTRVFESSSDQKVRTVELRVTKDNRVTSFVRPVTELVVLVD